MLSIVTYPNPVLEREAATVSFPLSDADKQLIKDMWTTVKDQGVGLAAPQVGVSKQICIIHLADSEKGRQAKDIVMINPQLLFQSETENLMVEGCLSFPGEYYKIWRPANIVVTYQDEQGRSRKLRAGEWLSRVIQHEVDHLNGRIFTTLGGEKIEESELDEPVVD